MLQLMPKDHTNIHHFLYPGTHLYSWVNWGDVERNHFPVFDPVAQDSPRFLSQEPVAGAPVCPPLTVLVYVREDEAVPVYPLVQESAAQLIEASLHTKQQTLLLHKEVEGEHVEEQLREKRAEFQRRMDACSVKRTSLQRKQQEVCVVWCVVWCGVVWCGGSCRVVSCHLVDLWRCTEICSGDL